VLTGFVAACRDSEPPPAYYVDLGSDNKPLPPPAPTWKDSSIREGTAEWRPFTPANATPKPAVPESESPPAGLATAEGDETEKAVREFIKEFNEVVAEKAHDELPDYFVKSQRGPLRELLKVRKDFLANTTELVAAIEEKSAEAGQALRAKLKGVEAAGSLEMTLVSLTVIGPTEATGTLSVPEGASVPEEQREALFKKVGREWQVELKQIEAAAAALPMMQTAVAQFDTLISAVKSGAAPVDAVVKQLDAAFAMLLPHSANGPSPGDSAEKQPEKPSGE